MLTPNDQKFMKRFTDEVLAPMMQSMGQGPVTPDGYRAAMANLDRWKNETPVPEPTVAAYHPEVELRAGLNAAIAVPQGDGPFPVFVITHGNGLAAGSSYLYRRLTKDVAAAGYLAITPDFRLAPEHPFPAGHDDIEYTLRWVQRSAGQWGGDAARMALWGDSLAAPLALGVILSLHDKPDAPELKAFVGAEGFYDFTKPEMRNPIIDWYIGDGGDALRGDKRVSPVLHIKEGLTLPSVLLITGSADGALAPTLDLARALAEARLPFELHVLEGMPHDFMKFPELDGMREGHRLMFDFLARCW